MTGPITALGIRDGDPEVLRALVQRRGSAVLAFCEFACPPDVAEEATAAAFARFRAAVLVAERPADLHPETALLSATRHAAAPHLRVPVAEPAGALGRLFTGRQEDAAPETDDVAALLAARADGTITVAEDEHLARVLDASPAARSVEDRLRAAEQAYKTTPMLPVPEPLVEAVVAAMLAPPALDGDEDDEALLTEDDPHATRAFAAVDAAPDDRLVVGGPSVAPARVDDGAQEAHPDATVEWHVPVDGAEAPAGPVAEAPAEPEPEPEPARTLTGSFTTPPPALPRPGRHRAHPHLPGRGALAPAAAVLAAAAIGSLAVSGAFGGDQPSPPLDTGIVPQQTASRVPEGQAASVVEDLREAADRARVARDAARQERLLEAEQARQAAAAAGEEEPPADPGTTEDETTPDPTDQAPGTATPSSPGATPGTGTPGGGSAGSGATGQGPTGDGTTESVPDATTDDTPAAGADDDDGVVDATPVP